MTIEGTRKKILEDDIFVLNEIGKIRYLYRLKKEIRYDQDRAPSFDTESVAEHIYGMHVLAQYFLPLEDPEGSLDEMKILQMITWHDMDEIETGDIVTHHKTTEHRAAAEEAIPTVLSKMPKTLNLKVKGLIYEYEAQETPEAKFVKAIDKSEPFFEVWETATYKDIFKTIRYSIEDHWNSKRAYIKDFPLIMRFSEVATRKLMDEDYFYKEGA